MRHKIKAENGKLIPRCVLYIRLPVMVGGEILGTGCLVDMDDEDARELIASGRAVLASSIAVQFYNYINIAWHRRQESGTSATKRKKAKHRLSKHLRRLGDVAVPEIRHASG